MWFDKSQNISPALWQIYLNDLVNITIKGFTTIFQQWLFLLVTCCISTIYLLSILDTKKGRRKTCSKLSSISISDLLREGSINANAKTPSISKGSKGTSKI